MFRGCQLMELNIEGMSSGDYALVHRPIQEVKST